MLLFQSWVYRPIRVPGRISREFLFAAVAAIATSSVFAGTVPAPTPGTQQIELVAEAIALEHGEGVEKNQKRAFELYCRAAREGDAEALFSLGWMYANARAVERDDAMAALLFELAAERGHEHATKMKSYFTRRAESPPDCMRPPVVESVAETGMAESEATARMAGRNVPKKIADLVNRLSPEYRVHPRLALAVIQVESNFDPNARSPKNAQGIMQLIPETAQRFNVSKPFDPEQNIRGGLAYLRWLLAYFKGNVPLVAAGYNAGEGAVVKYRGIPPYPETRGYVKRVLALYQSDSHPFDPRVVSASSAF